MVKRKLSTNEKSPVIRSQALNDNKEKTSSVKNVKDTTKKKEDNVWNPRILDDIASSLVRLSREYDDLLNSTIYNNLSLANIRTELTEDMLNHVVTSVSNRMEQSIDFTKALIKCKDIKDFQSLQQKMLEMYFPQVINFHLSLVRNLQKFEYNRKPGAKK
jgi:hypothetical protein